MKTVITSIFLIIHSLVAFSQTDSLLNALDKAIVKRAQYSKLRENRIDSLNSLLSRQNDNDEKYRLLYKVFREYRSYHMDSALAVAQRKKELAKRTLLIQNTYESEMNVAEVLGIMGMYKESLEILEKIELAKLDHTQKAFYFHLHHSLYTRLYDNMAAVGKEHYNKLLGQYRDSLIQYNEKGTNGLSFAKAAKHTETNNYQEALNILNEVMAQNVDNLSVVGMAAYEISEVYAKMGDLENEKKYLTISSISDVKRASKTYVSLTKLAVLLYKEGDVNRAYNYIKCAMEDASYSKARFRSLQISEALPIIVATYDNKMKQEKANLFKSLVLISILSFVLIVSIFFIYRQMKNLSKARKEVGRMLEDVKVMNSELSLLNEKLSDSTRIKEEYIGFIFNLCSNYIDKMEKFRKAIHRKILDGKVSDASKLTGSSSLVVDELKEFFQNFDAIFLSIFPNFVEDFNKLLVEDEKIYPKSGDLLSPELRVLALVRLGITESNKIATFLHYSPQTVYNYNLKVRNKLAVSKEDFLKIIQQIGL